MSIIPQLAKVKAKGHAESNQQLVNISEGSAKDKDINLKPYEQPHNSKLVFPKALCRNFLDFNFYLFFRESFFMSGQEVQCMNKLSLRRYSTKYNKF